MSLARIAVHAPEQACDHHFVLVLGQRAPAPGRAGGGSVALDHALAPRRRPWNFTESSAKRARFDTCAADNRLSPTTGVAGGDNEINPALSEAENTNTLPVEGSAPAGPTMDLGVDQSRCCLPGDLDRPAFPSWLIPFRSNHRALVLDQMRRRFHRNALSCTRACLWRRWPTPMPTTIFPSEHHDRGRALALITKIAAPS
jgi:hypothetical protein